MVIQLVLVSVVAICALLLGLITLANNSSRFTNRAFAALCLSSSIFTTVNFLADQDQAHALFWARTTFSAAAAMLLFLLLFINNFPHKILARRWEILATILSLAMIWMSYQPDFIPEVMLKNGKTDVHIGSLYGVFIGYLMSYLFAAYYLVRMSLKRSTRPERVRIHYLVLGFFVTAGLLSITNLFLPLAVGNNDLSGLGSYFVLVYIGFSAYAIIRHRLFNVRLLVARSIAYSLLLITLAIVYIVIAFWLGGIIFGNTQGTAAREAYNVALALILAFTFQPLRRFFEKITDRIFYRDRYDSQQVLNDFSKILVSELHLDRILKQSLSRLCNSLHIQYGQLVVYNHDGIYRIEHFGPLPKRMLIAPELAKLDRPLLVADELEAGDRKSTMDDHSIRVSLVLRTREEFIGYLLLGDKLSGDIYSSQDIETLEIIGKELAVAILNAKAYAEIQEFNVTLQQRVDHATNRLRVANRHLKELDKAKDEFISMASHQLRTPLTTIKGYLSMLAEGDAGPVTATQRDFVDYAFGASERMVNLISDLLNVSRLSAGRFLIETKPTDMVHLIEDEMRQLENHASTKGLKLIFDRPPEPMPSVEIDDNKTRQVVMNFIDNAIYYTKTGTVTVGLRLVGDNVRLEVRDTGIGVPEIARKHLFSKFFRAENAQTVRPDGTGLGLYLAKRVIEDQGGTIVFSSVEGKGSTFGFELPIHPALPAPIKTAKSPAKKDSHDKP